MTTYTFNTLSDGSSTIVTAVNDAGEVVGYFYGAPDNYWGYSEGFSYINGSFTEINPWGSGSYSGNAFGVNNAGVIVGENSGFWGAGYGYSYYNGTYQWNGTYTQPYAVNNAGEIAGFYYSGRYFGFIDNNGIYTTLYGPDGFTDTYAIATSINNADVVAGNYTDSGGTSHGFVYQNGVYTTLDGPNSTATSVSSINDAGATAGTYTDSSGKYHGFVYKNGVYTTLDDPNAGSYGTVVTHINNDGVVVGYYEDSSGNVHGFTYSNGVFTTVDDTNATNGTYLVSINNAGEVVGNFYSGSTSLGFTATPFASAGFLWAPDANGNWTKAADWSTSTVPGLGNDVSLPAYANPYKVTSSGTVEINTIVTGANATLSITGGTFTLDYGTGYGTNAGAINVGGGAALNISGIFSNSGQISATGTGTFVNLIGGSISGGTLTIGAAATLAATGGSWTASTIGGGAVLTDKGTLLATEGATLYLDNVTVNAAGGIINADDTLSKPNPAAILLAGATVNSGTLTTTGASYIETVTGTTSSLNGVTISAGSTVTVVDNSTLTLQGTITDKGTIQLNSTGDPTDLVIGANVTLTGSGQVTLTEYSNILGPGVSADATLTNNNNTISGAGSIGNGDGTLTLINKASGIIDANVNSDFLTIDTGNTVTNAGTLEAGTLEAAGTISSFLVIDDSVTNTGTIAAQDGSAVILNNSVSNKGTIQVNSSGDPTGLFIGGTVTLTGTGKVVLSDTAFNPAVGGNLIDGSSFFYGEGSTSTLFNQSNTISGAGSIGFEGDGSLILNNAGTINANESDYALIIDTGNPVTNSGLMEATGGAATGEAANGLIIHDSINNSFGATSGTIKATGTGSTVDLIGGSIIGGTVKIGTGATLEATGGLESASTINGATVTDTGILLAENDTQLTLFNAAITATGGLIEANDISVGIPTTITLDGGTTVTGGTLEATAGGEILLNGATVINSTLESAGAPSEIETEFGSSSTNVLKGVTISSALSPASAVTVSDGSTLTLEGTITNDATISLNSTGDPTTLVIGTNVTLTGGGDVTLSNELENQILGPGTVKAGVASGDPATLTNTNNTIAGAGSIGDGDGTLLLTNGAGGTIDANGLTALTIDTGNKVTNNGTLEATNIGGLVVDDPLAGTGSININSGDTVTLQSSVGSGQTVTFENNSAGSSYLVLGTAESFAGKVATGFAVGDYIDLLDFNSATTTITGVKTTSGVTNVTLTDSSTGNHETVHLVGTYTLSQLAVESAAAAGLSGTSAVLHHT